MDIQNMVLELIRLGRTQTEIADRVHRSQATISDIANGKVGNVRPAYDLVKALEEMLKEAKKERKRLSPSVPKEGARGASDAGGAVLTG